MNALRYCAMLLMVMFLIKNTSRAQDVVEQKIISYSVDPKSVNIGLYWKDDLGVLLRSLSNLKSYVEQKEQRLLFAMNGGMYMQDNTPLGLFIQQGKAITSLNTKDASGNFYLKPNGVFYITKDGKGDVRRTEDFKNTKDILYATQSGPMLIIDGKIHPAFKEGSVNLNVRNGVGILSDGTIIFAISTTEVNFYDFASFFKAKGCINALYLDGFVSRAYFADRDWKQLDGNFGVMIGVSEKN